MNAGVASQAGLSPLLLEVSDAQAALQRRSGKQPIMNALARYNSRARLDQSGGALLLYQPGPGYPTRNQKKK